MPGGAHTATTAAREQPALADGRAARAQRTRGTIVDALLAIIEEGEIQPTAHRIAERAGISMRLIYHHFGDLESLFRAAAARQAERLVEHAVTIDPSLPLRVRIDQFVAHRTEMLEWITPVRRASLLQEPFSTELQAARDALMVIAEDQVRQLFADVIADRPEAERDTFVAAVATTCGWGFWNDARLSGRDATLAAAAVRTVLEALCGSRPDGDGR